MERFITETRFVPVEFDPFAGPAIERVIPTTEAQREVFAASEMGAEASCAYNESVSLELTGDLDRAALEKAMHALIARHEALRSTLNVSGTRMIVAETILFDLPYIDLSKEPDREARAADLAHVDMTTPFDLRNGPLFRAQLIRMEASTHLLRLTGHHVVCDGWSLGIMMAEISALYNAAKSGKAAGLPEANSFGDYSLATIDFAQSPEHAQVEAYWKNLFKGPIPRLDLPTDRPRPRTKTYTGDRLDLPMAPELVRGLKETATRSGASFVTTLLTTFELLLYKLTGDGDLVVGLPAAGQSDLGMKHLVGHCVNLLALRSRIDEDRPFIEHLKERRSSVLDAFDNQKCTFGTLLRKLRVPREPGRIPLCPVVFNIDMNMDDGVAFDGLRHRFISNPRAFENFELFLNATGNDQHLVLEWSYNTDLFDQATVRGWMKMLTAIAQRVATSPGATIADLLSDDTTAGTGALPPTEWLSKVSDFPKQDVGRLFDAVATQYADNTAVELLDQRLSYRELQQRVHALSDALIEIGVRPGDPVGLCMDRGFDMIIAMLATLRAGGCFVPFDPAYPAERLAFMFRDTDVKVMLTQHHLANTLPKHNARTITLDQVKGAAEQRMPSIGIDAPAYIMYTSGSTGTPKGVVVPHRAIVRLVREQNFLPFGPDLTFLQLSNISFDASTLEIWGALLNGGRLVLQPQQKPTLQEITESIRQHQVTTVWFTSGLFNLLVDEHVDRLRGLKHILAGGDVLSVPHVKKALKVLGPNVLINGYGPTENTTFTCCFPINDEASIKGGVPIGFPLNNTTVHILDEHREPVPIGRQGELYTGGAGVALGYWKRDDLTAARFVDDPFSDGGKLYRTGDLARWTADGTVEFIGRADGQVKIRGFRVELGEIENALNDLPGIKDRVVLAVPEQGGGKRLVAFLLPTDAHVIPGRSVEHLESHARTHLRERLPDHMVPTAFVILPEFPLNANGKVDRSALSASFVPTTGERAEMVEPRDEVEAKLHRIWCTALGNNAIGVLDNFFDVGGHSLIGIQLLAQVEEAFGRALEFKQLFMAPTIAQMAQLLREPRKGSSARHLLAIQPKGDRLPIFCIHGDEANVFLPKYLGEDQPFYAISHQGEDGRPIERATVEELASDYVEEIRQVRPHGPYFLFGYSFGGIIAYEIAQQLSNAGEDVPMVALLDTFDPIDYNKVTAAEARAYQSLKDAFVRGASRLYFRSGKILPAKLRHNYIIGTYDRMTRDYEIMPFTGSITLLRTRGTYGSEDMGWSQLARGGLDIRYVPGDHFNVVKEPHVRTVADELRRLVDALMASRISRVA